MCDDFMDEFIEMECVMPGMITGEVDVVCDGCGQINTYEVGGDCTNLYQCPKCGVITEI